MELAGIWGIFCKRSAYFHRSWFGFAIFVIDRGNQPAHDGNDGNDGIDGDDSNDAVFPSCNLNQGIPETRTCKKPRLTTFWLLHILQYHLPWAYCAKDGASQESRDILSSRHISTGRECVRSGRYACLPIWIRHILNKYNRKTGLNPNRLISRHFCIGKCSNQSGIGNILEDVSTLVVTNVTT